MIPYYWIIDEPIIDMKDREILFMTAQFAGYVVDKNINSRLKDEMYVHLQQYIRCNGIYIHSSDGKITITEIKKDKREVISYEDILQLIRENIRQGNNRPILKL